MTDPLIAGGRDEQDYRYEGAMRWTPEWQPGDPVYPNLVDAVRCPDCTTQVSGPGSRPPMQCPECGGAMEAIEESP